MEQENVYENSRNYYTIPFYTYTQDMLPYAVKKNFMLENAEIIVPGPLFCNKLVPVCFDRQVVQSGRKCMTHCYVSCET